MKSAKHLLLVSALGLTTALFAGGALTLGGCATPPGSSASADTGTGMMKTFAIYKDGWNRRDGNAIAAVYHPNGTYTSPTSGGPLPASAVGGFIQGLFTAVPDCRVEVVSVAPVNDHMLAEQWVFKGTWTKPFPGGPLAGVQPSGKSFVLPGSSFIEIRDGKIVSDTVYFDNLSFLTQIGVIQPK